jgi:hypothetical protein
VRPKHFWQSFSDRTALLTIFAAPLRVGWAAGRKKAPSGVIGAKSDAGIDHRSGST